MADAGNIIRQALGGGAGKTLEAMLRAQKSDLLQQAVSQDVSEDAFMNKVSEATNPFAHKLNKSRKSKSDRTKNLKKAQKARTEKGKKLMPIGKVRELAARREKSNTELRAKSLMALRQSLESGDDADTVLRKVNSFYKDPSLADEALEFLEETTTGETQESIKEAKEQLEKQFGREIRAGKNIADQARAFAEKGLGTPTSLRDMYREITGNPRDAQTLFSELSGKFDYEELSEVVKFLFHSLGSDMKSQGPSIPRGLLHNLFNQTRVLQSIMGVFTFFKGRMRLMKSLFAKNGIPFPKNMTFETLAKQFMLLAQERYPTPDKALASARRLGLEDWLLAKIIALSQMRDAVRNVAMGQIYKSMQHRDDLLLAIIEALEDLEDEWEEEQEGEEEWEVDELEEEEGA